jgi:iron complex transport system ATP-binding protein
MIRVKNLHFSYPAGVVFRGLDVKVNQGEILSLIGPNGCGKSTFLKLLRGALKADSGEVLWEGKPVADFSRKIMAQKAAVVSQSNGVYFSYTVRELVTMGRFSHRPLLADLTSADREIVDQMMSVTDVVHLAGRPATDLSGGELQRVMLARALAQDTPVLLLDEATSHLDLIHRLAITDMLVQLNREHGTTIIQVSHDLDLAAETSHRILLFSEDGGVAALGTPTEVFTPENIKDVFGVDVEVEISSQTGAPRIHPVRANQLQGC